MRVNDITKVKPAKDFVVVRALELEATKNLFFAKSVDTDPKNAELSFGEVIATGPLADNYENCPGVIPKDKVVFNRYAGSHIATKDVKELYKIMGGYSIMALIEDINNLNEDTIYPSANRLLIAVKFADQDDSGLILSSEEAKNPQLEDIDYGTVLKVGPSCKLGYKVGDIVAYNPYAGENIRPPLSVEKPALRVLIEEEVLLTI